MADYKEILNGGIHNFVDKLKETAETTGVRGVYVQGAERAKTYARIAKLTVEQNSDNAELGRVYTEIGRLYYKQARYAPTGVFVPLFEQAERITGVIREREAEIAALRSAAGSSDKDLEVEITSFEDVVNATEEDGVGHE